MALCIILHPAYRALEIILHRLAILQDLFLVCAYLRFPSLKIVLQCAQLIFSRDPRHFFGFTC
jgi:hypothetical protein